MTRAGGGSRSQRSVPEAGRGHLSEEEGREGGLPLPSGIESSQGGADQPQLPGDQGVETDRQAGRQTALSSRTVDVTSETKAMVAFFPLKSNVKKSRKGRTAHAEETPA